MEGEELAASRAFGEVQEERAPCSLVLDVTYGVHPFYESPGSTGAVRSYFGFTARLLAASMRPSSTHSHSVAAVHPVSYVYDVSRLASVCFNATL